ncbi:MAG: hypothetical protein AB7W59_29630 [Acidimicrobiia bacterium]
MSTDHQTDATGSVSLTVEALELSLLAPRGWTAELIEEGVRLYGPADEQAGGARPTWSITRARPDGFGEAWFAEFTAGAVRTLSASFDECVIDGQDRFTLSSRTPVHVVRYHWRAPDGTVTHQLQATISRSPVSAYVVHAATRGPRAAADVERFDAVVRSLRFLPPRL